MMLLSHPQPPLPHLMQSIIKKYDIDRNGTIELPEFLAALSGERENTDSEKVSSHLRRWHNSTPAALLGLQNRHGCPRVFNRTGLRRARGNPAYALCVHLFIGCVSQAFIL